MQSESTNSFSPIEPSELLEINATIIIEEIEKKRRHSKEAKNIEMSGKPGTESGHFHKHGHEEVMGPETADQYLIEEREKRVESGEAYQPRSEEFFKEKQELEQKPPLSDQERSEKLKQVFEEPKKESEHVKIIKSKIDESVKKDQPSEYGTTEQQISGEAKLEEPAPTPPQMPTMEQERESIVDQEARWTEERRMSDEAEQRRFREIEEVKRKEEEERREKEIEEKAERERQEKVREALATGKGLEEGEGIEKRVSEMKISEAKKEETVEAERELGPISKSLSEEAELIKEKQPEHKHEHVHKHKHEQPKESYADIVLESERRGSKSPSESDYDEEKKAYDRRKEKESGGGEEEPEIPVEKLIVEEQKRAWERIKKPIEPEEKPKVKEEEEKPKVSEEEKEKPKKSHEESQVTDIQEIINYLNANKNLLEGSLSDEDKRRIQSAMEVAKEINKSAHEAVEHVKHELLQFYNDAKNKWSHAISEIAKIDVTKSK